jgi:hypothetical protein
MAQSRLGLIDAMRPIETLNERLRIPGPIRDEFLGMDGYQSAANFSGVNSEETMDPFPDWNPYPD